MTSPADDEVLPALPPIKTAPLTPPPCASVSASASASPSTPAPTPAKEAAEEGDHEPSTPTSEESRLRPPTVCPPAPRKPRATRLPVKRKPPLPSPARVFVTVPRDLSTVFRALSPKKRIRVS